MNMLLGNFQKFLSLIWTTQFGFYPTCASMKRINKRIAINKEISVSHWHQIALTSTFSEKIHSRKWAWFLIQKSISSLLWDTHTYPNIKMTGFRACTLFAFLHISWQLFGKLDNTNMVIKNNCQRKIQQPWMHVTYKKAMKTKIKSIK